MLCALELCAVPLLYLFARRDGRTAKLVSGAVIVAAVAGLIISWVLAPARTPSTGVGDRVPLVHANDSRDAAGSGRDRHQAVGEGTIGEAGFAAVLAHPGLAGAAFVNETSGDPDAQAADVARLKALRPTPGPRR